MGRELKRVPLDFKWPIGQVWIGYLNPYRCHECQQCKGSGRNKAMNDLSDEWYGRHSERWVYLTPNKRYNANAHQYNITEAEVLALVKGGRLSDLTGWVQFDEELQEWYTYENKVRVSCQAPIIPTTDEVNEWAKVGFGHDGINHSICLRARAKELGVEGDCDICNGEGYLFQTPHIKELHESWEQIEPPVGDGFQLWETTSEGSPKSPVFNDFDSLCEWCASNASTFASFKASKEEWKQMLDDGFVAHKQGNVIMF